MFSVCSTWKLSLERLATATSFLAAVTGKFAVVTRKVPRESFTLGVFAQNQTWKALESQSVGLTSLWECSDLVASSRRWFLVAVTRNLAVVTRIGCWAVSSNPVDTRNHDQPRLTNRDPLQRDHSRRRSRPAHGMAGRDSLPRGNLRDSRSPPVECRANPSETVRGSRGTPNGVLLRSGKGVVLRPIHRFARRGMTKTPHW